MQKKRYYKKAPQAKTTIEKVAKILLFGSFFSFLFATIFSSFPIFVFVWNIVFPSTSQYLSEVLSTPIHMQSNEKSTEQQTQVVVEYTLPEKDPTLPVEPTLQLQKIGVKSTILEQPLQNYELALQQGVWRVPNFGTPLEKEKPIILVAHRFGYISWSQEYREKNSFYNLPNMEVGDQIEIIWDQRKFIYEIYASQEGTDITQYDADLILYTCKFLKSDIRIFKYAKLVEN